MGHRLILVLWFILICCVVIGSLASATSPVMVAVGYLPVSDNVLHFGAYLALAMLPVIGFPNRRRGIIAGLSRIILGVLLEAGQYFSVGRAVEVTDLIANATGVGCGVVFAFPIRARIITAPPVSVVAAQDSLLHR